MSIISTLASVLPLVLDGKFLTGLVVGCFVMVTFPAAFTKVKGWFAKAEAVVPTEVKAAEAAVANTVTTKL